MHEPAQTSFTASRDLLLALRVDGVGALAPVQVDDDADGDQPENHDVGWLISDTAWPSRSSYRLTDHEVQGRANEVSKTLEDVDDKGEDAVYHRVDEVEEALDDG